MTDHLRLGSELGCLLVQRVCLRDCARGELVQRLECLLELGEVKCSAAVRVD
jgi:hypothetical protein